ncbi:glycogen synthase [Floccifex porci]|uniref:Glycogen synthase n=1 Tax=Floccifex porci TaxID=2606629 RepID=A0A7X2T4E9_9FIRM|nr:glycogen/starch synthase [Floccifex porci]MSS01746.1 glycogen synthase [Floccifex porci]
MAETKVKETQVAAEEVVEKKTTKKRTKKAADETKAVKKTTKKATKKPSEKEEKPKKTTKKAEKKEKDEVKAVKKTRKKAVKKDNVEKTAKEEKPVEEVKVEETKPVVEVTPEVVEEAKEMAEQVVETYGPRKSVAFIGSECFPFVKTGGLGDVMYALPKALVDLNCDVRVLIPNYKCIPYKYKEKMVYRGSFYMDLCSDGRKFYVGIMEYINDGVIYDFIDNEEFFSSGNPYTSIVGDIPKFCYFAKAALAALNYMNWSPDVIHCHDWQAALIPVYVKTVFAPTPVGRAKTILTVHNLRFQGIYNVPTIQYWTNLPYHVFNVDGLGQGNNDANMLKGGLAYADMITTVSHTYANEIQTWEYGEKLDAHLRYHNPKLHGIVNGIDIDIWNPATDEYLASNYDVTNVVSNKVGNKMALQTKLGLDQDHSKFVIGLISRLTDQKGLDLINAVLPEIVDDFTQVVILGTGDKVYEDAFRKFENDYRGNVSSSIMYDEARSHEIYAGVDALLVPSRFEPCGLTQLIAMRYGTVPIVRETGGLKDTVAPYNKNTNDGNGFTFDRYDAGLLLDAINRAKTLYFNNRWCWDEMVQRDMAKDVSWENSAKQYKDLYVDVTK